MKILFLHFPIDNYQIEGKLLPDYFASKGHLTFSAFEKGNRNFYSKHKGLNISVDCVNKGEIIDQVFDLIICKSDSFQKYGKIYKSKKTKVFNVTPMGISRNLLGIDHAFSEDWLIKPPVKSMKEIFKNNFIPYNKRDNCILIPGAIGNEKNQKEIVRLFNNNLFKDDYYIHFAGPVKSQRYADELKQMCAQKNIKSKFGHYSKPELAHHYLNSKIVCLSTDPRPFQPFDPSPRVIFEALAAGTPCIVSDLVITHKYSKMFCKTYINGSEKSFLKKVKETLNQDLIKLSSHYHNKYESLYSMENACSTAYKEILNCYQKINS